MASRPERFVGIDVHKDTLEVHLEGQDERWEYSNDTAGIGDLVTTFGPLSPTLVVVEASGGYERAVVSQGYAAGLPMVVVNPTRVRRLAEAMGIIAKTDAIDAQVIARFASVVHPPVREPQSAQQQYLNALVTRRRQLVAMRTAEKNRLSTCPALVRAGVERHVAWFDAEIEELEDEIHDMLVHDPSWHELVELISSVPGIGEVTAATLVAELPELHRPAGDGPIRRLGPPPTRARHDQPPEDRRARRPGTLQQRQWSQEENAPDLWRTRAGAMRPVHGYLVRHTA